MKIFFQTILLLLCCIASVYAYNCEQPTAQVDLDVNNVRAKLLNGGDLWWDIFGTGNPRYEVPKSAEVNSFFATSLLFGGLDASDQLYTSGQTYRQIGLDFWPGPITNAFPHRVDKESCERWDKMFSVYKSDIQKLKNGQSVHASIAEWPGNGNTALLEETFMAPFYDKDGDGIYEPNAGEYPVYDVNNPYVEPDQMVWWVMNDMGNTHTSYPGSAPIGIEIQATAFAIQSANILNNSTLYRYKLINKSNRIYKNFYIGLHSDVDLGYPADDFIGCDVNRNLIYVYNGDDDDNLPSGFGIQIPSAGIRLLLGPKDNGENRVGLKSFARLSTWVGDGFNPRNSVELYNCLRGLSNNGAPIYYGFQGNDSVYSPATTTYFFPGNTDPLGRPEWTEITAGSTPTDRRTIMSTGDIPFLSGQIMELVIGVPWAMAPSGNRLESLELLKTESDKMQLYADYFLASTPVSQLAKNKLHIYPNPIYEGARIEWNNPMQNVYSLKIFSMNGELLREEKNIQADKYFLHRNGLSSGVYILQLRSDTESAIQKIILH